VARLVYEMKFANGFLVGFSFKIDPVRSSFVLLLLVFHATCMPHSE
jgi:hypothetical protein